MKLLEIANQTYAIKETTDGEMIILPYEESVIGFDGKALGEKKISWTGYGTYQP